MSSYENQWPVAKFSYQVVINGVQISFSSVSGLDQKVDIIEYRHGDSLTLNKIKRQGLESHTNIVLEKGIFDGGVELTELFNLFRDREYHFEEGSRFDMTIELLDDAGGTVMMWNAVNCLPVALTGTDMKSDDSSVAIEKIEIAYEQLFLEFS